MKIALPIAMVIAAGVLSSPAFAQDPPPPDPPTEVAPSAPPPRELHFDLGAGTQFPTGAGLMTTAELPHRVLVQLDLGWMPEPYAHTIDDFLKAIGAYDDTVSQLIRAALGNSFVMRAAAGWRPFSAHGFEFSAGYTLVSLGGSLGTTDAINAFLKEKGSAAQVSAGSGDRLSLHATLHSFQIQAGWRWLLASDKLVLRASISYLQCVAASSGVDLDTAGKGRGSGSGPRVSDEINTYLSPYFTTYVKAPVVGLSAAYRF